MRYFRFGRMKTAFHFGKMKSWAKSWARSVSASRAFWHAFLHWESLIMEKKWPVHQRAAGRRKNNQETSRTLSMFGNLLLGKMFLDPDSSLESTVAGKLIRLRVRVPFSVFQVISMHSWTSCYGHLPIFNSDDVLKQYETLGFLYWYIWMLCQYRHYRLPVLTSQTRQQYPGECESRLKNANWYARLFKHF